MKKVATLPGIKMPPINNAPMGAPQSPHPQMPAAQHLLGRPGASHSGPAHFAPVPPPAPPSAAGAVGKAQGGAKLGYEYGALHAVKEASRIGQTVPTGYQFNLDPTWMGALSPDAQAMAQAKAQLVNKWLAENASLNGHYAQSPEFARHMVALSQLAKQKSQVPGK